MRACYRVEKFQVDRVRRLTTPSNISQHPSVTLCIGSGSYISGLAAELHRLGLLHRGLRLTPKFEVLEDRAGRLASVETFPVRDLAQRIFWAAWRRLPVAPRLPLPILITARIADHLTASRLGTPDILHALTGNALSSLAHARKGGAATILEHPMVHPRQWQEEVLQECAVFSLDPRQCGAVLPEAMIRRREQEFNLADYILVPSTHASATFHARAVENTKIIPLGVDTSIFHPTATDTPTDNVFRVCYSGRLDLGKGTLYLLQAWQKLRLKNAELVLMGELRPEIAKLLPRYVDDSVVITGFIPRHELAERLRRSPLYVFPSLHEGMAQSVLEAMASGIPVIATTTSGAADCLTHRQEGFLIKPRDVDDLANNLLWCYEHRAELRTMGMNARRRVETDFTEVRYLSRLVEFYREVVNSAGAQVTAKT